MVEKRQTTEPNHWKQATSDTTYSLQELGSEIVASFHSKAKLRPN